MFTPIENVDLVALRNARAMFGVEPKGITLGLLSSDIGDTAELVWDTDLEKAIVWVNGHCIAYSGKSVDPVAWETEAVEWGSKLWDLMQGGM